MPTIYHDGQRQLQQQFDTMRLADKMEEKTIRGTLTQKQIAFIQSADMVFLATADEQGQPTCSYRGGDPGFVRVVDAQTIAIPNYDGNGMYLSWGNTLKNAQVGLLFIDFMKGWRLRVHGRADIMRDYPLLKEYPGAQFIVRITTTQVFPNCPRYIHRYQLVERSPNVPREGFAPPIPDWKKQPDVKECLAKSDPARNTS